MKTLEMNLVKSMVVVTVMMLIGGIIFDLAQNI